jgi:8-oxo-dGTP pyrophosphatase MutT (NUDIX family)
MNHTSDGSHSDLRGKVVTRLRLRLARPYFRWSRGMTLGARVAVIDGEGRFLLVQHTYQPGWILPGGGVERGESTLAAARREVEEEAAIIPSGPMTVHGVFSNHRDFPGDHLVVYVLREFERRTFKANIEIADARFFHHAELPGNITAGSQRRIAEIVSGAEPSAEW